MYKASVSMLTLVLAFTAHAQNTSGSISGHVIDHEGAVVPGAAVTVNDPAKNITVTVRTSASGDFVVPGLQPGNYNVRVEATGFKKVERTIPLDVNDKLALGDIPL